MDMTSLILHHHVCVDHLIKSSEAHWQRENVSNECDDDDDDDEGENNLDLGWWHSLRACVEYLRKIMAMATQAITGLKFEIHVVLHSLLPAFSFQQSPLLTGWTKGFCSTISQGLQESSWKLFDE